MFFLLLNFPRFLGISNFDDRIFVFGWEFRFEDNEAHLQVLGDFQITTSVLVVFEEI